MKKRTKLFAAGASVFALAAGGTGLAIATGGDDSEAPIDGAALEKASAAALEATGGGEVTETETGDEESYYEVEVTRADGSQVDVQLNRGFEVVSQSGDSDTGEDEGADDRNDSD